MPQWRKQLDQLQLRDKLMLGLLEEDGINPQLCTTFQEELNTRYKLIADLLQKRKTQHTNS